MLSKDPVLRYQVGKKKNENATVHDFFKYRWYREPGSWPVQPYDFRNAENVDAISESRFKNGIYSLARNVTDFVKVWMNESKVGRYT